MSGSVDFAPFTTQTSDSEGSACPAKLIVNGSIRRWKTKEMDYIQGWGELPGPHPVSDHPWNIDREAYILNDF